MAEIRLESLNLFSKTAPAAALRGGPQKNF